jgi:hypothetical protein
MAAPSAWGGKREGAGRPALFPAEPTVRATVTLPAALAERLRELGAGNLSAGIRRLAEASTGHAHPHGGPYHSLGPLPHDHIHVHPHHGEYDGGDFDGHPVTSVNSQ